MSNLTQAMDYDSKPGDEIRIQAAAVKNYRGGAASVISGVGYATPLRVGTAGTLFIGVYEETNDNSNGTPGTIVNGAPLSGLSSFVRVARTGIFAFNQSGITQANVQQKAYFSDDNTVATTAGSIEAGTIVTVDEQNGVAWVDITNAVKSPSINSSSFQITAQQVTTNVSGAAQTLSSFTIPANTLKAGDIVKLRGKLIGVTRTSTDTTSVALLFGATTIATLDTAFAHATTNFLYFDLEFVVRTAGAGGTAVANGLVSTGTAGATVKGVNMASATFDTTAAEAFIIQGTFSASNTTDQIGVDIFDIQIVRA